MSDGSIMGTNLVCLEDNNHHNNDYLVISNDSQHPANLIPELCRKFWTLGWVTGTGGGASIRKEQVPNRMSSTNKLLMKLSDLVYLAPSGVQKELLKPEDIYVLEISKQSDLKNRIYLRSPPNLKPSQCTPLFLAAFMKRNAGCCIHTHSQWAVLITLLLERRSQNRNIFEINNIEQIKAFGRGWQKSGAMGYHDTLRIPVIENTPFEEDLTQSLEIAMDEFPDTYAVLVRRHGLYVWGETAGKAKQQAESSDGVASIAVAE